MFYIMYIKNDEEDVSNEYSSNIITMQYCINKDDVIYKLGKNNA